MFFHSLICYGFTERFGSLNIETRSNGENYITFIGKQVPVETKDFPDYPLLDFQGFEPIGLDFILTDGVNGVDFNNELLLEIGMFELFPNGGNFDFEAELFTTLVPIPGAIWLLGGGLIGLLGLRRRIKR